MTIRACCSAGAAIATASIAGSASAWDQSRTATWYFAENSAAMPERGSITAAKAPSPAKLRTRLTPQQPHPATAIRGELTAVFCNCCTGPSGTLIDDQENWTGQSINTTLSARARLRLAKAAQVMGPSE